MMSHLGAFLSTSTVKSSVQHTCDLNSAVLALRDADVTSRQRRRLRRGWSPRRSLGRRPGM